MGVLLVLLVVGYFVGVVVLDVRDIRKNDKIIEESSKVVGKLSEVCEEVERSGRA